MASTRRYTLLFCFIISFLCARTDAKLGQNEGSQRDSKGEQVPSKLFWTKLEIMCFFSFQHFQYCEIQKQRMYQYHDLNVRIEKE